MIVFYLIISLNTNANNLPPDTGQLKSINLSDHHEKPKFHNLRFHHLFNKKEKAINNNISPDFDPLKNEQISPHEPHLQDTHLKSSSNLPVLNEPLNKDIPYNQKFQQNTNLKNNDFHSSDSSQSSSSNSLDTILMFASIFSICFFIGWFIISPRYKNSSNEENFPLLNQSHVPSFQTHSDVRHRFNFSV